MIHTDTDSDEEIQADAAPAAQANANQAVADRVAAGEVPIDILQRQRGNAPAGAYVLTEQEA